MSIPGDIYIFTEVRVIHIWILVKVLGVTVVSNKIKVTRKCCHTNIT